MLAHYPLRFVLQLAELAHVQKAWSNRKATPNQRLYATFGKLCFDHAAYSGRQNARHPVTFGLRKFE